MTFDDAAEIAIYSQPVKTLLKTKIILLVAFVGILAAVEAPARAHVEVRCANLILNESVEQAGLGAPGAIIFPGSDRRGCHPVDSDNPKLNRREELDLNSSIVVSRIAEHSDDLTLHLNNGAPELLQDLRHSSFSKILFRVIISPNAP